MLHRSVSCRWLPLKHRSYNKRGRKNRGKFVGGQGSGDGAQKDMQKLDAYARSQAATAEGSSGGKDAKGPPFDARALVVQL